MQTSSDSSTFHSRYRCTRFVQQDHGAFPTFVYFVLRLYRMIPINPRWDWVVNLAPSLKSYVEPFCMYTLSAHSSVSAHRLKRLSTEVSQRIDAYVYA